MILQNYSNSRGDKKWIGTGYQTYIDQANLFNVFFHSAFALPDSSSVAACLFFFGSDLSPVEWITSQY